MAVIQLGAKQAPTEELEERQKQCDEVGVAVDQGTLGDIVAKHQKLILRYYEDVLQQAKQSFELARSIALIGFYVLIGSLACAILLDILHRFKIGGDLTESSLNIGAAGLRARTSNTRRSYVVGADSGFLQVKATVFLTNLSTRTGTRLRSKPLEPAIG